MISEGMLQDSLKLKATLSCAGYRSLSNQGAKKTVSLFFFLINFLEDVFRWVERLGNYRLIWVPGLERPSGDVSFFQAIAI